MLFINSNGNRAGISQEMCLAVRFKECGSTNPVITGIDVSFAIHLYICGTNICIISSSFCIPPIYIPIRIRITLTGCPAQLTVRCNLSNAHITKFTHIHIAVIINSDTTKPASIRSFPNRTSDRKHIAARQCSYCTFKNRRIIICEVYRKCSTIKTKENRESPFFCQFRDCHHETRFFCIKYASSFHTFISSGRIHNFLR